MVSRIEKQLVSAASSSVLLSPYSTAESVPDSSLTYLSENYNSLDRSNWSPVSSGFDSTFDSHWDYADSRALEVQDNAYQKHFQLNVKEAERDNESADVAEMTQRWEEHIAEKNKKRIYLFDRQHPYGFPRWRSNDALSASLVASGENITIPADSSLPPYRLKMMQQTEQTAKIDKEKLHRKAGGGSSGKLNRNNLLSRSALQLDYEPWYDRKKIRENIISDSIANSKATKERFENGLVWKDKNENHKHIHGGELAKAKLSKQNNTPKTTQFTVEIPQKFEEVKDEQLNSPKDEESESGKAFAKNRTEFVRWCDKSNGIISYKLSDQERRVLSFLKNNNDVIEDLGIIIPPSLKAVMETGMKQNWKSSPEYNQSIGSKHENISDEREEIYDQNISKEKYFIKPQRMYRVDSIRSSVTSETDSNIDPTSSYSPEHKTWQYRFHQTVETPPPENKRFIVEDVSRSRSGRDLIDAEIRLQNDRENELKRSRSELGLPDLQEMLQIWRYGHSSNGTKMFHQQSN